MAWKAPTRALPSPKEPAMTHARSAAGPRIVTREIPINEVGAAELNVHEVNRVLGLEFKY